MNVLILTRQKPENAPFATWLKELALSLRVFTSTEREGDYRDFPGTIGFDDYENNATVELEVLRLHQSWPIGRIVATSEADVLRAGRLRTMLSLEGQSGESAYAFRDKIEMKRRLAGVATTFDVPACREIHEACDLLEFIATHPLPVVVKPVDGSGSVGTVIVRTEDELRHLLRRGLPRGLEVETFVAGEQYHVDGLVVDGELMLCWPSKYLGDSLSFQNGGITAGTMLAASNPLTERLRAAAREVLAILPTPENTSFHLELFRTADDRLVFCEIASRTGGGSINPMLEQAFGINLNEIFVRRQAGLPVDKAEIRARAKAPRRLLGWGLVPPRRGVFLGFQDARPTMPWVADFTWTLAAGAAADGPASAVDRAAVFLITHDGGAEAEDRLRATWQWAESNAVWRQRSAV